MPMRQVNLALLTSVSLVCAALAAAPAAQAAFASDPPGKSSTVTVTVDGVTISGEVRPGTRLARILSIVSPAPAEAPALGAYEQESL